MLELEFCHIQITFTKSSGKMESLDQTVNEPA